MFEWDSELYVRFLKERTQPAIDLANKIYIDNPKSIIDIGCGPGNSTRILKERFPDAYIIGADNSPEMIDKARKDNPDIEFIVFDANKDYEKLDGKFDIVFSNACIQWLPDHANILRNMMSLLNDGGILAVQTPMNYSEPIHVIITELAYSKKWRDKFENPRVFFNMTQSEYFDVLSEISSDFSIWETIYCHRMPSHESILDWYKGTGLRPYLSALSPSDAKQFEAEVFDGVIRDYPKQKDGEIIFRFPRFFFTAVK